MYVRESNQCKGINRKTAKKLAREQPPALPCSISQPIQWSSEMFDTDKSLIIRIKYLDDIRPSWLLENETRQNE